jgi:chorismate-pyruvate lyase
LSLFAQPSAAPAYPLDEFYAAAGLPMPRLARIDADEVPEPYRELLVHEDDMTPTLRRFHGVDIHLRVLSMRAQEGALFREVVLVRDDDEAPVEFGAIRINVDMFPAAAQPLIVQCVKPLGTIMEQFDVPHRSNPTAYFCLKADRVMREAFGLNGRADVTLYGRHNVHLSPGGEPMAHVVEILPPMEGT